MQTHHRFSGLYLFSGFISVMFLFTTGFGQKPDSSGLSTVDTSRYEIITGTFLGNERRNYYGNKAPEALDVLWKLWLGKGKTVISRKAGTRIWAGAGWTGQPLLYRQDTILYLIQGAYDHHLKIIDPGKREVVWQYLFDDVVKGTGTLWILNKEGKEDLIVFQGSRLGTGHYLDAPHVPSFRAISLTREAELWRLDSKWTQSYSRDVDASPLIINDTLYIGLENSLFTVINPDPAAAGLKDGMIQPEILKEIKLYTQQDVRDHNYNVVTEASPSRLGKMIFIASGSGHVFRYNIQTGETDWDFYTGSDIDGSPVVTRDSCILVSVEKQYIPGPGGVFKLNPFKPPEDAVIWFLPTDTAKAGSWEGGVIGSCAVNDAYIRREERAIGATMAIDGFLYLFAHEETDSGKKVTGPDSISLYPTPVILEKKYIGPSISTPLIVGDKLIAAGYDGIRLFRLDHEKNGPVLHQLGSFNTPFEATPAVWDGKIYAASRDGFLYCFGKQGKYP